MIDIPSVGIGRDCTFEIDDFGKPRLRDEAELVKNLVITVLFTRPGNIPSLPHIGLDIHNLLYSFYDEISEDDLENQITTQCQALSPYFRNGSVIIRKMKYKGNPTLLINVSTSSNDTSMRPYMSSRNLDKKNSTFFIGVSIDELNKMLYSENRRYTD
jgi:hypothetical protein